MERLCGGTDGLPQYGRLSAGLLSAVNRGGTRSKAADLRILTTLTLSRALSGVTALVICAGAIWLAGSAAPYLFVILSLPMTLFQMASVSQDGSMVACAALAVAIFVDRRDNGDQSGGHFVAMTAAIALVAMARFPYAVLSVLVLLYPGRSWWHEASRSPSLWRA